MPFRTRCKLFKELFKEVFEEVTRQTGRSREERRRRTEVVVWCGRWWGAERVEEGLRRW